MAAALTSTSTEHLKESIGLIVKVIQKCDDEKRKCGLFIPDMSKFLERASYYTGLYKEVLYHLTDAASDLFNIVELEDIDRTAVQNQLANFYLNEAILPTTKELFVAMHKKLELPPYIDIRSFRSYLIKLDYVWKYIPNYTLVVMERPLVTFARFQYLQKMIQYREENKPIYFVDVVKVENGKVTAVTESEGDKDVDTSLFLYAASKSELIALKFVDEVNADAFEDWVQKDLLKYVPVGSVVVIDSNEYTTKEIVTLPTAHGLKCEIMDWLDYHDIPYSPSMSKTELFDLAEKFANPVDKLYKVDKILKLNSCEVLRIPPYWNEFVPTMWIRRLIGSNLTSTEPLSSIITSISANILEKYDSNAALEEKTMYDTACKVDSVIDDLFLKMKAYGETGVGKSKVQEFEDSDVPVREDLD